MHCNIRIIWIAVFGEFGLCYAATKGKSAICLACFKALVTILWCLGQVPVRLWFKILACGDIKRRKVCASL